MAPTAIEADIAQYYPGRRIAEFWRSVGLRRTGEMTPRELIVLVTELPDESRFKRQRSTAWTLIERLVAASINISHSMREDYRNAHGVDYDYTPVTPPELAHEQRAREARERAAIERRQLARTVIDRMLSGQLRIAHIDVTKPIEEALNS